MASPELPSVQTLSSFPQEPEEFDADPRVSFSKLDNKFILEADDGQEFEFDDGLKRWVPAVRPQSPIPTMRANLHTMAFFNLTWMDGQF